MSIKDNLRYMYGDSDSLRQPRSFIGYTLLTKEELVSAQSEARSAAHAARLLGIDYKTYRKYCDKFGVNHLIDPEVMKKNSGSMTIEERLAIVLDGKMETYTSSKLKQHLTSGKYYDCECSNCGLNERRVSDGHMPILMDYLDGNKRNFKWENLRFLCYNCYFLSVGNIVGRNTGSKKKKEKEIDLSKL